MYFLGLFFPVDYSNFSKIITAELNGINYQIHLEQFNFHLKQLQE